MSALLLLSCATSPGGLPSDKNWPRARAELGILVLGEVTRRPVGHRNSIRLSCGLLIGEQQVEGIEGEDDVAFHAEEDTLTVVAPTFAIEEIRDRDIDAGGMHL